MRVIWLLLVFLVPLRAVEPRAGGEISLEVESLPRAARVFLPDNWTSDKKWPAIFFYAWTGGPADTGMIGRHTRGQDFIIVGMPPREDGTFEYNAERLALEAGALREVRERLAVDVKLDPARVFVAGFSKGGWIASLLLAHEPGIAGGCVLGAGWIMKQHAAPKKITTPVYVYIGAGRLEWNHVTSLRASSEFTKLGARVTWDAWPDTGHEIPKGGAEGLRQWLALVARGAAVRDEALKWAEDEMRRIDALPDAVERWYEFRRFNTRPFARMLGVEWTGKADARIAELLKQPAVAAEAALDRELSAINEREIQDMKMSTLDNIEPRYQALAAKAPESPAGKLAKHETERIKKLRLEIEKLNPGLGK